MDNKKLSEALTSTIEQAVERQPALYLVFFGASFLVLNWDNIKGIVSKYRSKQGVKDNV